MISDCIIGAIMGCYIYWGFTNKIWKKENSFRIIDGFLRGGKNG